MPPYLDAGGRTLLAEGRKTFRDLDLSRRFVVKEDRDIHVFLWEGSAATAAFSAALAMRGVKTQMHDLGVTTSEVELDELRASLRNMSQIRLDAGEVAGFIANIKSGKFKEQVPDWLARDLWASNNVALVAAVAPMAALG